MSLIAEIIKSRPVSKKQPNDVPWGTGKIITNQTSNQ